MPGDLAYKRKTVQANEKALRDLVRGYLHSPRLEFFLYHIFAGVSTPTKYIEMHCCDCKTVSVRTPRTPTVPPAL